MKTTLFIIGLIFLFGCSDPIGTFSDVESVTLEDALRESDLVKGLQLQISVQDSIIGQMAIAIASQQSVLDGFSELHKGQEELNIIQGQLNSEAFKAISLLANR